MLSDVFPPPLPFSYLYSTHSFLLCFQVAGFYTADKNAAYYGANATPNTIRDLVKEALIPVANDPSIDLAQFVQEARYDLNGNGNRNE
ncbi:immune inhibitor A domain-containing protein, partial [Aeromonas salmonicida]|uniref:immune inhibitor A domain-containing protein n=1 Tax=Aeromonas salmonicida TaxID=645 RepID=UPI003D319BAD